MRAYCYYATTRNPAPGTVPPGYLDITVWGSRPYTEEIGRRAFGTVYYERKLTAREALQYDLAPANVVQEPVEIY